MSQEILNEILQDPRQKVKVALSDLDGILRGKYMHKNKFLSAAEDSFGFCNVVLGWDSSDACYDYVDYTGLHTGFPDTPARVDLKTYRRVPWDNHVAFFLAEFLDRDGGPLDLCPRQLLKKVLAKAERMGFAVKVGMEFEWFNFQETPHSLAEKNYVGAEPLTPGMFGYSILRTTLNQEFFNALMDECLSFGIPIEGLHTETGPGVFEAAITVDEALESADRAILFKSAAKEIGLRFGIMPSFMAKPSMSLPGCSGHIHQSLWDEHGNTFYDANDKHRMSETFRHYLAGQMLALPEVLPMYAPTINSYKRLVEGYWAPTRPTWGVDNRTTAFRVIPGSSKSTRLEVRIPGADVNPYLAMAASIASGLYGIEKKLALDTPAIEGNAYAATHVPLLPRNLYESSSRMAESELALELLGERFVRHFTATRFWEWKQFHNTVTDWELKRYFEII
ncbi:glutamine synthetase [bacterium (Candidatus Blackallbacteria) CG17_big_fil_post_rev_8_21_14_2_50_48_46]|uniref:Glutamine synthetase n=1 Tax=bacterium (Candidatus Blackallbacteria) CG17_big_fil_post_rev_8_21_14_2_50_48_46 TaxID=2014261 RepID=A0A2M7FZ97_9BACT|nr:MAG: glutamine synthetase [bacterium (Candidatus Blackallbacteria) CG18_big_fil_WC_8_21_14_2_50_49_26]PIW14628.1 MAG: glutamine synthetase [bacterium (Candidatus Blackallbacteria) CG17_big_fil_post_rev_8_21_14_2_50_48_46]PIW45679.1 MAG: glutamine synthetase [bacterium (Candidatus Blackallbacteria) CG13_big_fil_rev_8_21_14_2_50_49_14]